MDGLEYEAELLSVCGSTVGNGIIENRDRGTPLDNVVLSARARGIVRVGHRGAAGHAPENTVAAIIKGISLDVDFVEVDVQASRDGRLVLMHDATVDRTTNGTGLVAEMTWAELQRLDAGGGERVPSVEQALAAANGVGVILELKAAGIGAELVCAVKASGFAGEVVYASFIHAEIAEIRRIDADARTMALIEEMPAGADFALEAGAALVGLDHEFTSAESIAALHAAGLGVMLFNLNTVAAIERGIRLGADGIISDYPELVPQR